MYELLQNIYRKLKYGPDLSKNTSGLKRNNVSNTFENLYFKIKVGYAFPSIKEIVTKDYSAISTLIKGVDGIGNLNNRERKKEIIELVSCMYELRVESNSTNNLCPYRWYTLKSEKLLKKCVPLQYIVEPLPTPPPPVVKPLPPPPPPPAVEQLPPPPPPPVVEPKIPGTPRDLTVDTNTVDTNTKGNVRNILWKSPEGFEDANLTYVVTVKLDDNEDVFTVQIPVKEYSFTSEKTYIISVKAKTAAGESKEISINFNKSSYDALNVILLNIINWKPTDRSRRTQSYETTLSKTLLPKLISGDRDRLFLKLDSTFTPDKKNDFFKYVVKWSNKEIINKFKPFESVNVKPVKGGTRKRTKQRSHRRTKKLRTPHVIRSTEVKIPL